MTAGRRAIRLSEDEIADFLTRQMKVQVATIGSSGVPHLSTLYYVLDAGRIAFWTYGASQKAVNLRRDPRIVCLVEDGRDYMELRGVSITGRATLVEDYDRIRDLGSRVMARMAQEADPAYIDDAIVARQARKRVGVIVEPEKVASWDHRKLQ